VRVDSAVIEEGAIVVCGATGMVLVRAIIVDGAACRVREAAKVVEGDAGVIREDAVIHECARGSAVAVVECDSVVSDHAVVDYVSRIEDCAIVDQDSVVDESHATCDHQSGRRRDVPLGSRWDGESRDDPDSSVTSAKRAAGTENAAHCARGNGW